jgi:hypothetical protein
MIDAMMIINSNKAKFLPTQALKKAPNSAFSF